ncbi:uncharacterized protein LOC134832009 [Culicoides brevitarsis]|uniref:uncharacterized protein LOC134832009 n=1 Tax=Culicoides brevitarsis TaxID=469753 RepID=UPI00307C0EA3
MKFILAALFVVAFAGVHSQPPTPSPQIIKIVTDCMEANSLTLSPHEIHDILDFHCTEAELTAPKKCFVKCFAERTFVLDAAGKPNSTTLKGADLPECFDKAKMTDAVIAECGAKTGATPCDVGYEAGKCLVEKAGVPHEEH